MVSLFAFVASFGAAGFSVVSLVYSVEISSARFRVFGPALFYIARSVSLICVSIVTMIFPGILTSLIIMGSLLSLLIVFQL